MGTKLHTYGVIEFFTSNPILFLPIIVIALFWIGLAVFFIIHYFEYNKPKDKKSKVSELVKVF